MNKYQEALDFLKEGAYESYSNRYIQTSKEKVYLYKSSKALQELVDKATPKKPIVIDKRTDSTNENTQELQVTCRVGEDKYQKYFLRLIDEVTYTVEQIDYSEVSNYTACPCCETGFSEEMGQPRYCEFCGQRLDWSEEE